MKAYAVNAQLLHPSPSNFVYVELINQQNEVLNRIKLKKDSAGFQGYIKLNEHILAGEYALRAYTNWMRNEVPEYFFQKNITIERVKQTPQLLTIKYIPIEKDRLQAVAKYTYSDGSAIKGRRIDFTYTKDGRKYRKNYSVTNNEGEIRFNIRLNEEKPDKQKLTATIFDQKWIISHEQNFVIPNLKKDFDVQFFPESGTLLTETWQFVAFKAIHSDGLCEHISGKVISEGGNEIAQIHTQHDGMGKFALWPHKDSIYYAVVTNREGVEKKLKLPEARIEGMTLRLNIKEENCLYSIENHTAYSTDSLFLIAHTRGMISVTRQLTEEKRSGKFSLSQCPEGILNVAVVDRIGNVFCERMLYVKKAHSPAVQIKTNSQEYGKRERVEMLLNTGQKGEFSLSVTDAKVVKWDSLNNHIISQLLLKSEIKGHIEKPGYYFTSDNKVVNEHLDLLMLTQGWRRYNLPNILQQQVPEMKIPLERGQALSGRVKPFLRKKIKGAEVVGFTDKLKAIHAKVDTSGNYVFEGIEFPDSTAFTINAVNKKGKAKGIMIYPSPEIFPDTRNLFIPNSHHFEEVEAHLRLYKETYIQNDISKEIVLDDIVVTQKYISQTGKLAGEFAAYADYVVTDKTIEEEYKNKSVADIIHTAIMQRFPGITMVEEDHFWYRGKPLRFAVDMKLIQYDELRFYMAEEIASISFFKEASEVPLYVPMHDEFITAQMNKYRGVILIELKKGGTAHYFRPSLGLATLYPLGYQKPAEFYSPKYDVPDSLQADKTDFRTTVYWNPKIQTDSTGHAKVSFYTTDMKHDMEYILEGITENGIPCRATGRIKVKKE
ncbi:hypothetical protein NXY31_12620 [Bacteroides salyersiae]|nr:hypothetical protein [Bacteroides salyersiae]